VGSNLIGIITIKWWINLCPVISRKKILSKKAQKSPYSPEPKQFDTEAQDPLPPNTSVKLDTKGIKHVHRIVGGTLYYARAVNMTMLKALNLIAVEQTKATVKTMAQCTQILDYLSPNADAKIPFHASDMILNIQLDAAYLSEPNAQSHACGHFFMGWKAKNGEGFD
jgi:hypothetical protein